jgi:Arc/MetJ-type ribon-helix-helix transcriptional regulator
VSRPKKERRKVKTGVTIDPDLYDWVESQVESKEFANITHAVEKGLFLLKEKMESKK